MGALTTVTWGSVNLPFLGGRSRMPRSQRTFRGMKCAHVTCHERPIWRLPQRLHFLFWTVYFPRRPHCPPLHCNLPFVH